MALSREREQRELRLASLLEWMRKQELQHPFLRKRTEITEVSLPSSVQAFNDVEPIGYGEGLDCRYGWRAKGCGNTSLARNGVIEKEQQTT
jgi:hypothetical protein